MILLLSLNASKAWFGHKWAFKVLPELFARIAELVLRTEYSMEEGVRAGRVISHYIDYFRHLRLYNAILAVRSVTYHLKLMHVVDNYIFYYVESYFQTGYAVGL